MANADETRQEREKRLAIRLRDNLKRRKSQQRARTGGNTAPESPATAPVELNEKPD